MFLRRKPVDSKGDMNKRIIQYNNNGSNKNEDENSLNESVSAGQDEVYIINDIINNKKSTKNVPTHQLQMKDNDNTINDLQNNKDNKNKKDNNSSNNSNTPIRSEGNRSNNIIKGNRKKNCTSSVPTYYSKNKIVTVTFIINVATMIIVITTQTMFKVKM